MLRTVVNKAPAWTYSAVCFLAILYLTLFPDPLRGAHVSLFPGADKVVHAIMMMGMMLCLAFDTLRRGAVSRHASAGVAEAGLSGKSNARRRENSWRAYMGVLVCFLVLVVLFGGAIELLQDAMGLGRSKDFADFVADSIGAVVGWLISLSAWNATVRWLFPKRE
jgi:hypothetical protein